MNITRDEAGKVFMGPRGMIMGTATMRFGEPHEIANVILTGRIGRSVLHDRRNHSRGRRLHELIDPTSGNAVN